MTLRYTRRARRHLEGIAHYIAERNANAALRVGARIRETIELLEHFPEIGRHGVLAGTRELVVPSLPYIVVYRIETGADAAVTILGIYHGAQLRPGQEMR
jgi:addiction module RelE/StbE family toxin